MWGKQVSNRGLITPAARQDKEQIEREGEAREGNGMFRVDIFAKRKVTS